MKEFTNVQDVAEVVMHVAGALRAAGRADAAEILSEATKNFYTTATEALGEIRAALRRTEQIWTGALSLEDQALSRQAVDAATKLMGLDET
jgi:hypothetical protein